MRTFREYFMQGVFLLSACISILCVAVICFYMFAKGCPAIAKIGVFEFLTGTDWFPTNTVASYGIFPMIVGSIYVTAGAIIIGVPTGLLTAVFLSKFCPKKLYKIVLPAVNLLAGIPSIVYGFFGLVVVVPIVRSLFGGNGNSIITASFILGIMILPTVIGMSESSLNAVPKEYYEGSLALGATHERSVMRVVFPAAKSGICAAIVLAVGRAVGETMAVVMIAGNQARLPDSLTDGVRTLTANIVLEMGYASGLHYDALLGTGVVLFVFILLLNVLLSVITRKSH
ncbi:MAG: phosphate ABC transporter permease subunit PstC [Ruminococcus sp.]|nr:phosphate ABC transporter permease subunit PstC [Ruminococcus sp.]